MKAFVSFGMVPNQGKGNGREGLRVKAVST